MADNAKLVQLKENIRELLTLNTNGIPVETFWQVYYVRYKHYPVYKQLGVSDEKQLFESLDFVVQRGEGKQAAYCHKDAPVAAPGFVQQGGAGEFSMQSPRDPRFMQYGQQAQAPQGGEPPPSWYAGNWQQQGYGQSPQGAAGFRQPSPYPGQMPQQGYWQSPAPRFQHPQRPPPPKEEAPQRSRSHERSERPDDRRRSHSRSSSSSSQRANRETFVPKHEIKVQVSKDELDKVVKVSIDSLAEHGKDFVSVYRIEKMVLQHYKVESLRELGILRHEDIPALYEHVRKINKIIAYVQAYGQIRAITTLYDLKEGLDEFAPGNEDFSHLQLGPVTTFPAVYDLFRFSGLDKDIPRITTFDVILHLKFYVRSHWSEKIEVEKFIDVLVKKYGLTSPYHLGVRIRSLALGIQVRRMPVNEEGILLKQGFCVFWRTSAHTYTAYMPSQCRGATNSFRCPKYHYTCPKYHSTYFKCREVPVKYHSTYYKCH